MASGDVFYLERTSQPLVISARRSAKKKIDDMKTSSYFLVSTRMKKGRAIKT